jgi:hypothetical protein
MSRRRRRTLPAVRQEAQDLEFEEVEAEPGGSHGDHPVEPEEVVGADGSVSEGAGPEPVGVVVRAARDGEDQVPPAPEREGPGVLGPLMPAGRRADRAGREREDREDRPSTGSKS